MCEVSWRCLCGNRFHAVVLRNDCAKNPICAVLRKSKAAGVVFRMHTPVLCAILIKTTADIAAALRVNGIAST